MRAFSLVNLHFHKEACQLPSLERRIAVLALQTVTKGTMMEDEEKGQRTHRYVVLYVRNASTKASLQRAQLLACEVSRHACTKSALLL